MKKWISIVAIVLLVGGGGFWLFKSQQTAEPAAAQIMTTTVQKGDIKVQVSGAGTVSSINSTDITSKSEGIVDEILVEVNDKVEEGDELISFTDGSDPITATHAGTITSLDIESGNRIQLSQVVGHITDYDSLQTVISVDELDIVSIKTGQPAEITASAFPDETFKGTVTGVAKEGESQNGVSSFNVTVQFTDPKDLLIGMSTEVSITTESKQDVLYVPIESVKNNGGEKYVTIQESASSDNAEANTKKQVVETGINDSQNIEITSGLTEGQIVQLALTISSENQSGRNQGFPGATGGQGFQGGRGQGFPGAGGQGFQGGAGTGGGGQ
ncbi:efflux RND transporter periplasmic adaptor subunit [Robertmurraya sp. GLU-23]